MSRVSLLKPHTLQFNMTFKYLTLRGIYEYPLLNYSYSQPRCGVVVVTMTKRTSCLRGLKSFTLDFSTARSPLLSLMTKYSWTRLLVAAFFNEVIQFYFINLLYRDHQRTGNFIDSLKFTLLVFSGNENHVH